MVPAYVRNIFHLAKTGQLTNVTLDDKKILRFTTQDGRYRFVFPAGDRDIYHQVYQRLLGDKISIEHPTLVLFQQMGLIYDLVVEYDFKKIDPDISFHFVIRRPHYPIADGSFKESVNGSDLAKIAIDRIDVIYYRSSIEDIIKLVLESRIVDPCMTLHGNTAKFRFTIKDEVYEFLEPQSSKLVDLHQRVIDFSDMLDAVETTQFDVIMDRQLGLHRKLLVINELILTKEVTLTGVILLCRFSLNEKRRKKSVFIPSAGWRGLGVECTKLCHMVARNISKHTPKSPHPQLIHLINEGVIKNPTFEAVDSSSGYTFHFTVGQTNHWIGCASAGLEDRIKSYQEALSIVTKRRAEGEKQVKLFDPLFVEVPPLSEMTCLKKKPHIFFHQGSNNRISWIKHMGGNFTCVSENDIWRLKSQLELPSPIIVETLIPIDEDNDWERVCFRFGQKFQADQYYLFEVDAASSTNLDRYRRLLAMTQ
jgi:hypothetical protein